MVKFVAYPRHVYLPYDLSGAFRARFDIHHRDGVGSALAGRVQQGHEGQLFGLGLHGHLGRGVKSGIGSPLCHFDFLLLKNIWD
jgi:hypothetical protein